ncbi:LHFPL tetraspan subfamily member 2a protein [Lepeophtheirus salmonis]|uniref:Lipoma HMGIC fusion partner-like 2 protein n=1 Tax=Lepeophtheirus salmonis TaxID=72036 RepID=D3PJ72_LEPSM|nr:LHFPL tetraspan subfamily member 2a protein-like [Lepeophtheirus salmonis]ADD38608.1 Lipoma HMGIC fusion partner-like 2 protein [Lepeophtheirus salmonis]
MCKIIVTVRTVLWYVMSLAGTLMILVSLFTNKWLLGKISTTNLSTSDDFLSTAIGLGNSVASGNIKDILERNVGLFIDCKIPKGKKFFEGECIPDWENIDKVFLDMSESAYPHAWRGAIICFVIGLAFMIITDFFALMTICCRSCVCCSVFTICGSIQTFASILFILGLVAYPAGWGSAKVSNSYCGGQSEPFFLGPDCKIGSAFWLAVAGTVCCFLSSSLAIWAYRSTKTLKCVDRENQGDHCICLP